MPDLAVAEDRQRSALELESLRSPRLFRFKTLVLALAGELVFQLLLLLVVAVIASPIALGAIFLPARMLWPACLVLPAFWWALQPEGTLPGKPLARAKAPALYAMLDEVCQAADSLKVHGIRIDDRFNAAAEETGHGWFPFRIRRVMVLGGPLLAALTPQQLRAVVAHEIGHLSRAHGRLGHWLYRVRRAWRTAGSYRQANPSPLKRGLAAYAWHFANAFEHRAFVHSRLCEYEADRCAAQIVGAMPMALTLGWVQWWGETYDKAMNAEQQALLAEGADLPDDLWERAVRRCRAAGGWREAIERAWHAPAHGGDTHPSLRERVEALGIDRDAFFHALDASTEGDMQPDPVLAPPPEVAQACWAQAREAWNMRRAGYAAGALPDRRAGWYAGPDMELFERGRQSLARGERTDWAALEALVARQPRWAHAVRRLALEARRGVFSEAELERQRALVDRAAGRRHQACNAVWQALQSTPASLPAGPVDDRLRAAMAASLAHSATVRQAWLARFDPTVGGPDRVYPVVLLAVRLDPAGISDENEAHHLLASELDVLLAPDTIALVLSSFTTERLPAWQQGLQDAGVALDISPA